jgi:tetratricopeptide (TPR) repeat protein
MLRLATPTTVLLAAVLSAASARADDVDRMRQLLREAGDLVLLCQASSLLQPQPPDALHAANLWTEIGSAQAKIGEHPAAQVSFDRAWKVGAAIEDRFDRPWRALGETARQQVLAGQIREAIDHALGSKAEDRWDLFLQIATAQGEGQKDFAGARRTIAAYPATDEESRAQTQPIVVLTYLCEQNFLAALATCDRIDADFKLASRIWAQKHSKDRTTPAERVIVTRAFSKGTSVGAIVSALNREGRFDEALQAAARLKGDAPVVWERYPVQVAKSAADKGQIPLAQKCFHDLTTQFRKDEVAPSLVSGLAKAGRFQEASDLIDRTKDRTQKAVAIFNLAAEHARRGDDPSVQKEYSRVMAFMHGTFGLVDSGQRRIVAAYLAGGHLAKAVAFAEQLERHGTRSEPRAPARARAMPRETDWSQLSSIDQGIGSAAARTGSRDLALRMFDRSRAAARHEERDRYLLRRLTQLAVAEADAGFSAAAAECLGSAFDIVGQLDLSEEEVDDVVQFAASQVTLGQREFARKTLSLAIKSLSHRPVDDAVARSLQDVAQAQAWIGDIDEAIRAADVPSPPLARASVKLGVVQGLLARREGKVLIERADPLRSSGL